MQAVGRQTAVFHGHALRIVFQHRHAPSFGDALCLVAAVPESVCHGVVGDRRVRQQFLELASRADHAACVPFTRSDEGIGDIKGGPVGVVRLSESDLVGAKFGATDAQIRQVSEYLTANGLQVEGTNEGRTMLSFSGAAGDLEQAFHTEIHNLNNHGAMHISNISEPSVPASLADLIVGVSMSDFKPHPLFRGARTVKRNATTNTLVQVGKASADFTIPYNNSSLEVVAPGDFATIYNLNPVWIYINAKNGTFLPPVEYDFDFSSGAGFRTGGGGIGIADINGDGYPDLVGVAFDPGYNSSYVAQTTVSVLGMLNKGDGTLAAALPEQTTVFNGSIHSDLGQVVLADMNKDGKVDLILTASGDDNLGQHQPVHHGSADCHKLTSLARNMLATRNLRVANMFCHCPLDLFASLTICSR